MGGKNYERRRHALYHVAEERLGFCNNYSGFRLNVNGDICIYFKYYEIRIEKKRVQTFLLLLNLYVFTVETVHITSRDGCLRSCRKVGNLILKIASGNVR
jgi:hypothetical protein